MNASAVILISFFTSVVTSAATLYISARLTADESRAVREVVVPSLLGLSEEDARANLRASGLTLLVGGREAAADAQPDTVIRQSLPAGSKVEENQPVSVTLAQAVPKVPDVKGRTKAEAIATLEQAGYAVQVDEEPVPHETIEAGMVVTQLPNGGMELEKKRTVTIALSAGPAATEVPKLMGFTLGNAKESIKKSGFKLGRVGWVELAERPGYLVVNQTPKPEEKAEPGSEIDLVVNRGD